MFPNHPYFCSSLLGNLWQAPDYRSSARAGNHIFPPFNISAPRSYCSNLYLKKVESSVPALCGLCVCLCMTSQIPDEMVFLFMSRYSHKNWEPWHTHFLIWLNCNTTAKPLTLSLFFLPPPPPPPHPPMIPLRIFWRGWKYPFKCQDRGECIITRGREATKPRLLSHNYWFFPWQPVVDRVSSHAAATVMEFCH